MNNHKMCISINHFFLANLWYFLSFKYNNIYAILYKQHHLNHKSGTDFLKHLIYWTFCKFECMTFSTLKTIRFLTKRYHLTHIFGVKYSNSKILIHEKPFMCGE